MSNELKVLKELNKLPIAVGQTISVSFGALSKALNFKKNELDIALNKLDIEKHITQFPFEGQDIFLIKLNQKGFDLLQNVEAE